MLSFCGMCKRLEVSYQEHRKQQAKQKLYCVQKRWHPAVFVKMFRSVQNAALSVQRRILMNFPYQFRPQLATLSPVSLEVDGCTANLFDDLSVWFAVPKKRVTRHKKRLKTTVQKRIPLRKNIVIDPRTGEVTLMHRLPYNWKEYLPKVDE